MTLQGLYDNMDARVIDHHLHAHTVDAAQIAAKLSLPPIDLKLDAFREVVLLW